MNIKQVLIAILLIFCISLPIEFNINTLKIKPLQSLELHSSLNSRLKSSQPDGNFSKYDLSVSMDEANSFIQGNLTVNFYNNDLVNISTIPFHLYLSGMLYDSRQGKIEIVNVTDYNNPSIALPFQVYSSQQIMWVNLTEELEYEERAEFIIQFNATLPDGLDRANSHGYDSNQTRIFKFTGFYPIPCVYDNEDKWNIDPYLMSGDPFYFDMAYYNISIEAPKGFVIAATGQLEETVDKGATILHKYNPILPVREVTFSASRYYLVESKIVGNVNVSTFFIPKSSDTWSTHALNFAEKAISLFNETFGSYDYPTFNVVEEYTIFGGMEYPCQVYITEILDTYGCTVSRCYNTFYLEKFIVHETCHQWWYNLVGNDEIDYPFLDEGLAVWSTDYYGEYYYGNWEYWQIYAYSPSRYIDKIRTYYATTGLSSKINQSLYEYSSTNTDWVYISYYKAPLIFEILRQTIGHSNFINGLKLFFNNYKFEHAVLSDLQNVFEITTGESLNWFFFPWFDNLYLPDYKFGENHSFNDETKLFTFTIEDRNEALNDYTYYQEVPYLIYDLNNQIIESSTIAINGTTTVQITLSNTPLRIELLYNNYVLVQLEDPTDLTLTLYVNQPFIPGYELGPFLLLNILTIGVITILLKRKRLID